MDKSILDRTVAQPLKEPQGALGDVRRSPAENEAGDPARFRLPMIQSKPCDKSTYSYSCSQT